MSLQLDLPRETERRLLEMAAQEGRAPEEIASEALEALLSARDADRQQRILGLLDRWDAEDAARTDDLPPPEIPPLSLWVSNER